MEAEREKWIALSLEKLDALSDDELQQLLDETVNEGMPDLER